MMTAPVNKHTLQHIKYFSLPWIINFHPRKVLVYFTTFTKVTIRKKHI